MAGSVGATAPCELLATARRRHVILRPEANLWLVAVHRVAPSGGDAADALDPAAAEVDAAEVLQDLVASVARMYK